MSFITVCIARSSNSNCDVHMRLLSNVILSNDVNADQQFSSRPVSKHKCRIHHSLVFSFTHSSNVTCVANECAFTATGVIPIRIHTTLSSPLLCYLPPTHPPLFPNFFRQHYQPSSTMATLKALIAVALAFAATLAQGLPTAQPAEAAENIHIINGYFAMWWVPTIFPKILSKIIR
jgi:hypothetical protein